MRTTSAYLRWLADRWGPGSGRPVPGSAAASPHVIGQATGYSAAQIAPFVRSLRRHFAGKATLIVDDDAEVLGLLRAHDVRALPSPTPRGWKPHVVVSRLAAYDSILTELDPTSCALLTDVRDVVFQGDPLSPAPLAIEVFDEMDGGVFMDHAFDRKYAAALAGKELAALLDRSEALCIGTVAGPVGDLRRLCRILLMICAIPRSELGAAFGADQAALNLAVHLGLVTADVRPNFGRVATVGLAEAHRMSVAGEQIANPDGSISPIVHQYDRHLHLTRHVESRWNVATALRPRRHGQGFGGRARRLTESIQKRLPEVR